MIKLNFKVKYYLVSIMTLIIAWAIWSFFDFEFINLIFFTMAFIWHFTLLAPEMLDFTFKRKDRFSLITIVYKLNFYLQAIASIKQIPFKKALIRSISPILFSVLLVFFGGSGNLFFSVLGSFIFEFVYSLLLKFSREKGGDFEIPPTIPSEETFHE